MSLSPPLFIIGIDVGSTTTDCALINYSAGNIVEHSIKTQTSPDITSGIMKAIDQVMMMKNDQQVSGQRKGKILCVIIGTTHFVNAILSFSPDLEKVAVCRLGSSANNSLPPCESFPERLKELVLGDYYKIDGGYQVDGREILPVNQDQVQQMCQSLKEKNLKNIVISGIFSPINSEQEKQVADWIREFFNHDSELKITCSNEISEMGFMQRENASILNACLKGVSRSICYAFQEAIRSKYACPFFLTQNDGTLIPPNLVTEFPIFTIQSGPTNSMKGAAFLSGVENAIVVDIGGLTTDVGVLVNGFPRLSNNNVSIGNVPTNFRVPDVYSVAMGGGSIVSFNENEENSSIQIGPKSVGFNIFTESLSYGGNTVTTTDAAVALGLLKNCEWGASPELLSQTTQRLGKRAPQIVDKIHSIVEEAIDHVKIASTNVPVLLVGGGSSLIDENRKFEGVSKIIKPKHYQCANAVGAALCDVSGRVDTVINISASGGNREKVIETVKKEATEKAIKNGAKPESVEIVDFECIPLAYIPGDSCRFLCKAVGNLDFNSISNNLEFLIEKPLTSSKREERKEQFSNEKTNQSIVNIKSYQPNISVSDKDNRKEWILTKTDIDCIEIGSGVVSSGGGGSPKQSAVLARSLLSHGKEIKIISPESIAEDAFVLPVAMMGAPLVIQEKSIVEEFLPAIESMSNFTKKKIEAIFCIEIGGSNSITPLLIAATSGLPVVDCDGMGRAYPELDMVTHFIDGCSPVPTMLLDDMNNQVLITSVNPRNPCKGLESILRPIAVQMGSMSGIILNPISKKELMQSTVHNSYSGVWSIGKGILEAHSQSLDPIQTILNSNNGDLFFSGKISDVNRKTTSGFNIGKCVISGLGKDQGKICIVEFQNEFLRAVIVKDYDPSLETIPQESIQSLAIVPNIISIVDSQTGLAIQTEELRYGFRISVLVLGGTPKFHTPKGLKTVGPTAFGYPEITDLSFIKTNEFKSIF
ncbi:hydantoinase/oxoprolinase [Naegleria gruberi]|uniref:Hydantoinase/oxoprolinase n=1 Tax=Naegleria gruberi TaxID=5762 RepID=D2W0J3_NAEGR|nr:hydantoinase/oxoprolinase [Naegleria gruberi]EFC37487.1 hydantoinase/oxoprolinase [Naegleria gruberi]|eukprot:XP_002670231.1 hydantoinase/oxoprolinase [Naegleria gruberi strain NEG-M]